jgi:hypothetical protein
MSPAIVLDGDALREEAEVRRSTGDRRGLPRRARAARSLRNPPAGGAILSNLAFELDPVR